MQEDTLSCLPSISDLYGLSGKVALITGAAEGMGKEIARLLAGAGAAVAIADINMEGAAQTADEINAAGGRASAYRLDVGSEESVVQAVDSVRAKLGQLDILVNNAGIQDRGPLEATSLELWDKLIDINLRGQFLVLREAARVMRADGRGGRVVNIGSMGGIHPLMSGLFAYNISKSGVGGLTRSAAHELAGDGITVNAVLPGNVPTEGRKRFTSGGTPPADMVQRFMSPPLGRVGRPADIANAVLFLASPAAEWITGQSLLVDGGHLNR